MKKYSKPTIQVMELEINSMIAASGSALQVNETTPVETLDGAELNSKINDFMDAQEDFLKNCGVDIKM